MNIPSNIPSEKEIKEIWDRHDVPEIIRRHMTACSKIAVFLAQRLKDKGEDINIELVKAASLLHDIDKMQTLDNGDMHGRVAKELLSDYPEVGEAVEMHCLHLFPKLKKIEHKLINYADKRAQEDRVESLENRFAYGRKRYPRYVNESTEKPVRKFEKELFARLGIDPLEIKDMIGHREEDSTKAVIFDFDGVMYDTVKVSMDTINRMAERLGKPKFRTESEYIHAVPESDWRNIWHNLWKCTDAELSILPRLFEEEFGKVVDSISLYEPIKSIIPELSKRFRIAIATSNRGEFVSRVIENNNLKGKVGFICGYEDVEHKKPHPESLNKCMQHLGTLPSETIFIGDMIGDIKAARAAKLKKVIVVSYGGYHTKDMLEKHNPDIIVERPEDIIQAIEA